VRYEDFLSRPSEEFARVMEFLEIEDEDGRIERRIESELASDLKRDNFNKWKVRLTPRQIVRFDRIACRHLKKYGYESSVSAEHLPSRLVSLGWQLDNKVRKLMRRDYWADNLYKLGLRLQRYTDSKPGSGEDA
jgi:hypothetical protein